jgi:hypothetical protein
VTIVGSSLGEAAVAADLGRLLDKPAASRQGAKASGLVKRFEAVAKEGQPVSDAVGELRSAE